jgi:hypothetical protein
LRALDVDQLIVADELVSRLRDSGKPSANLRCDMRSGNVALGRGVVADEVAPIMYSDYRIEGEPVRGEKVLPVLITEPPPGPPPYVLEPTLPLGAPDTNESQEPRRAQHQPYLETALDRGQSGLLVVGADTVKLLFARPVATYGTVLWNELPVATVPTALCAQGKAQALTNCRIGMVGLGSLGSEMARLLALAGAGSLLLVDPDRLEPRNLRRHVCGREHLGRSKCVAVVDVLREHGFEGGIDSMEVSAHREKADEVRTRLRECDLLVCAADSGVAAQFVNHCASAQRRPAIIASVQFRPEPLAEVVIVDAQGGGCFSCLRLYHERRLKDERPHAHDPRDYPDTTTEPGAPELPQYQIAQVAAMACDRLALAANGMESSAWVMPLETSVPGYNSVLPRHVGWNRLKREAGCLVCKTLR